MKVVWEYTGRFSKAVKQLEAIGSVLFLPGLLKMKRYIFFNSFKECPQSLAYGRQRTNGTIWQYPKKKTLPAKNIVCAMRSVLCRFAG